MEFTITDRSIRIMAAAVFMMAKLGRDVYLEGSPAGLALKYKHPHELSMATAHFEPEFFAEWIEPKDGGTVGCKINAKALTTPFKNLKNVESLRMYFASAGAANYVVLQAMCRHSVVRTHSLYYAALEEDGDMPYHDYNKVCSKHLVVTRPGLLSKALETIGGAAGGGVGGGSVEQFTLVCQPDTCTFKSFSASSNASRAFSSSSSAGEVMFDGPAAGGSSGKGMGGGRRSISSTGGGGGGGGDGGPSFYYSQSHKAALASSVAIGMTELLAYELSMLERQVPVATPSTEAEGEQPPTYRTELYGTFDVTVSLREVLALLAFIEDRSVEGDEASIFFDGPSKPMLVTSRSDHVGPAGRNSGGTRGFWAEVLLQTLDRSVLSDDQRSGKLPLSSAPGAKSKEQAAKDKAKAASSSSSNNAPGSAATASAPASAAHIAPGLVPVGQFSGHNMSNAQHLQKLFPPHANGGGPVVVIQDDEGADEGEDANDGNDDTTDSTAQARALAQSQSNAHDPLYHHRTGLEAAAAAGSAAGVGGKRSRDQASTAAEPPAIPPPAPLPMPAGSAAASAAGMSKANAKGKAHRGISIGHTTSGGYEDDEDDEDEDDDGEAGRRLMAALAASSSSRPNSTTTNGAGVAGNANRAINNGSTKPLVVSGKGAAGYGYKPAAGRVSAGARLTQPDHDNDEEEL